MFPFKKKSQNYNFNFYQGFGLAGKRSSRQQVLGEAEGEEGQNLEIAFRLKKGFGIARAGSPGGESPGLVAQGV